MLFDEKKKDREFLNVITKITTVFNSFYVLKTGHCVSTDKNKPFVVVLDEETLELFDELLGGLEIFCVVDNRKWKKALTTDDDELKKDIDNYAYKVTSTHEKETVIKKLQAYMDMHNSCEKWNEFILSMNEEENDKLLHTMFTDNEYIEFKPVNDCNSPEIILTKSIFPLAKETTAHDIYYSIRKINHQLFCMVCDFNFRIFRVWGIHYYIPYKKKEDTQS